MSSTKPMNERVREALTVARQQASSGIYPPPPPADHKTLTQLAAEANGVTLTEPTRHSELTIYISDVKPGFLTDRAIKTKKPASPQ
jgi:hypothetical protein